MIPIPVRKNLSPESAPYSFCLLSPSSGAPRKSPVALLPSVILLTMCKAPPTALVPTLS